MAQSISQEAIGATGLPGATAASRHAGATTSGAPTTGTFAVGDYVVDQTGAMYVCTVAGTPGTWTQPAVPLTENVAGKNFLINGGFDIWQRGTSFTSLVGYAADRWYTNSGNTTVSQQTSGVPVGTASSLRVAYNSTGGYGGQFSPLESSNAKILAGKTVTLSVQLRCNSSFASSGVGLLLSLSKNSTANTMTGGTWTTISSTTIPASSLPTGTGASNWFTASITAVIPNDGTAAGILVGIQENATGVTPSYWEVAAMQLEIAPQATPFSRAGGSIGGELALCQRYYWQQVGQGTGASTTYGLFSLGACTTSTNAFCGPIKFPVTMRTSPSFSFNNTIGVTTSINGLNNVSAISLDNATSDMACLTVTASGLSAGNVTRLLSSGSSTAAMLWSAEL